jgi:acyl-homoserine lactone acylase PvdQ
VGAAGEQPVFSSNGNVPQRAFGDVVVDVEKAVGWVTRQRLPILEGVGDRQADQALGQYLGLLDFQPLPKHNPRKVRSPDGYPRQRSGVSRRGRDGLR